MVGVHLKLKSINGKMGFCQKNITDHGKNARLETSVKRKYCNILSVKTVPGCALEDVEGGDDVRPERGQEVSPVLLSCELTTDRVSRGSIGQPCPAWTNQFPASSPGSPAASMARALRRRRGGAMEHIAVCSAYGFIHAMRDEH